VHVCAVCQRFLGDAELSAVLADIAPDNDLWLHLRIVCGTANSVQNQ